jgi:hypothetical protein
MLVCHVKSKIRRLQEVAHISLVRNGFNLLWFTLVITSLGFHTFTNIITSIVPSLSLVVQSVLVHTLVYKSESMYVLT